MSACRAVSHDDATRRQPAGRTGAQAMLIEHSRAVAPDVAVEPTHDRTMLAFQYATATLAIVAAILLAFVR